MLWCIISRSDLDVSWAAWDNRRNIMYHWVEDKEFIGRMKSECSGLVNQLVQLINNEGLLRVHQHMVGSGAKNLITQNANMPVDLDYNLEIVESIGYDIDDCREIKEYVRKKFNEILNRAGWGECKDSTSALTTARMHFTKGDPIEFSIDLCIVTEDDSGSWYRLIHEKTGLTWIDRYFWNEARHSNGLEKRVRWLKEKGYWIEVRDTYLNKKNHFLSSLDYAHPSFIVYIETVNEVYSKHQ